jgi:Flp pilus assembly protein TadD
VRWSDASVHHVGYSDSEVRKRKLDRDARILEAELALRPGEPFILFNLGSIALERGDPQSALEYLRQSLAGSAATDSITRKLHSLIAQCHSIMGEHAEALRACTLGREIDPDDAELLFREATARRLLGDDSEAEVCWRRILTLSRPERFASVDSGIYGHLTRRNLAILAEVRGDREEARGLWSAVLAECPGDRLAAEALARLGSARPV